MTWRIIQELWMYRKSVVVVLAPLVLLPLLLVNATPESKCAYIVLLVGIFWLTTALPPFVTALLPVAICPSLGLKASSSIAKSCFSDVTFVTLGAGIVSRAVVDVNLHERIAVRLLKDASLKPIRLALRFWSLSVVLSVFVSQSATAAILVPMACQACQQTELSPLEEGECILEETEVKNHDNSSESVSRKGCSYKTGLIFGIIYSCRLGSLINLAGSMPSLILLGNIQQLFGPTIGISVLYWFLFVLPLSLIALFGVWSWLYLWYMRTGLPEMYGCDHVTFGSRAKTDIRRKCLQQQPLRISDGFIIVSAVLLPLLWLTREHLWGKLFHGTVTDSLPAVAMAILLFAPQCFTEEVVRNGRLVHKKRQLNWLRIQKAFPWTSLFLMGGGLAMAKVYQSSGLASWFSESVSGMVTLSIPLYCTLISIVTSLLSELTSAARVTSFTLPIIAYTAIFHKLHPIYGMITASVASSFVLIRPPSELGPIWTNIAPRDKVISGLVAKVICLLVLLLAVNTWAGSVLGLNEMPAMLKSIEA